MATGNSNSKIYLQNTENGTSTTLAPTSASAEKSVAFGPSGLLAVGDDNDSIHMYDTTS
jgi:hypothetical protein